MLLTGLDRPSGNRSLFLIEAMMAESLISLELRVAALEKMVSRLLNANATPVAECKGWAALLGMYEKSEYGP